MNHFLALFPSASAQSFQSFLGVSSETFDKIQHAASNLHWRDIIIALLWLKNYNLVFSSHFIWNILKRYYRKILWATIKQLYKVLPAFKR